MINSRNILERREIMNTKPFSFSIVLIVVSAILSYGCAGINTYGKLRATQGKGEITIEDLIKNWQAYDIYYAGYYPSRPSAVIFDLKEDGRKLVYDEWVPVTDQKTLVNLVNWMDSNPFSYPQAYRILGPDDQSYGFIISTWNHVLMKKIDETTMYVYDLPYPPDTEERYKDIE
jgi:hypothetical protein